MSLSCDKKKLLKKYSAHIVGNNNARMLLLASFVNSLLASFQSLVYIQYL